MSKTTAPVVKFHRNGCAGIGFYAVSFVGRKGTDAAGKRMVAIRFTYREPVNLFCGDPHDFYAVVCPDEPQLCWDPAYFLADIDAAIQKADLDGSAYK